MTASSLWTCGILGKVHGLRGELYLNLSARGLEHFELGSQFYVAEPSGGELRACVAERVGGADRRPIVRLDLAGSREEAIALQGRELLAAGDALDALPHYRVGDLIGARAETVSGRALGTVADVFEAPAHEILVLRPLEGSELLVPLVDELVSVGDDGIVRVVDGLLGEMPVSDGDDS